MQAPKNDLIYTASSRRFGTRSLGCGGTDGNKSSAFRSYSSATTAPNSPSAYSKPAVPLMSSTPTSEKADSPPYRFASIERLIHRKKIYDCNALPVVAKFEDATSPIEYTYSLSQKRELFFRQDGSPAAATAANSTNSTVPTVPNVNNYLSSSVTATGSSNIGNGIKENNITGSSMPYSTNKEVPVRDQRNLMTSASIKELQGYVGYASLPNQVYRKAVKRGFEFTLMVVGESGLGKSTLINSMFLTDIYSNEYPGPARRAKKTVQVESSKVLLKENGVDLRLTIVDTPGFGDAVDNSDCWQPIIDFIENKYEEYLNAESCVNRRITSDGRVHCCLYFLAPSGHGLKPLDIEFMKRLHDKVNILPLIAKADTMTPEECSLFKRTILTEIARNKIRIYEFPDCEDEDENKQQKYLKERVPFAVVGSNTIIEINGKRLRGRRYPWGVAEVENMEHCDFVALRNMLITTHMQDLKDVTNNVHYENFRCRKLAGVGSDGKPTRVTNKNPLAQMEEEKKEHEQKMKRMEQEMEQVFELKVREKMQKLKDSENDLQRRHEQMKKSLEAQRQELEEKWREFEKEKNIFEATNKDEELLQKMGGDVNSKDSSESKEKKKKKGLF